MNFTRRHFLRAGAALASFFSIHKKLEAAPVSKPIVISTWDFGKPANAEAWKVLSNNGRALDAVEQGVQVPEGDPNITTVGYGGAPDRDGHVTLDACIMDEFANCGSVAGLEHIIHPISVARKVMDGTITTSPG